MVEAQEWDVSFVDNDAVLFVAKNRHDEVLGMVDLCKVVHHYFAVDIAERTHAVLDLFDTDVVGRALHILDDLVVVVVDGVDYLVGLGIDGGVVAVVAFHVDASSFVHQRFHHSAEMH